MQRSLRPKRRNPVAATVRKQPPPQTNKRTRCGQCPQCLAEDCGKCEHCRLKKRFGGNGTSRNSCVHRRCVAIHGSEEQQRFGNSNGSLPSVASARPASVPSAATPRTRRGSVGDASVRQGDPGSSSDTNNKGLATASSRKKNPKRPFPEISTLERSLLAGSKDPQKEESTEPHAKKQGFKSGSQFRRIFGRIPPPNPLVGACALCQDDSKAETVLLCDGEGCEREYHLSCANLDEIPSGDWLCVDCHPIGPGTEALINYLAFVEEKRGEYEHSQLFVHSLVQNDIEGKSTSIPMSELERTLTLSENSSPDRWLGKPIWIRVPKVEGHVPGRIVDHRTIQSSETSLMEHSFLVRFAAGHYERKESFTRWMFLEEHQLLVGDRFVLARKTSGSLLQPALVYLRTTRELVAASMENTKSVGGEGRSPNIVKLIGSGDQSKVKSFSKSPRQKHSPKQEKISKRSPKDTRPKDKNRQPLLVSFFAPSYDKEFELVHFVDGASMPFPGEFFSLQALTEPELRPPEIAAALVEHEEQQQIIKWKSINMGNPSHPSALKSQDYFTLPPLVPREGKEYVGHVAPGEFENTLMTASGNLHAQPCPLVMRGLDHEYVMNLLHRNNASIEPSKELAAGLSCTIVPYKWPNEPSNT